MDGALFSKSLEITIVGTRAADKEARCPLTAGRRALQGQPLGLVIGREAAESFSETFTTLSSSWSLWEMRTLFQRSSKKGPKGSLRLWRVVACLGGGRGLGKVELQSSESTHASKEINLENNMVDTVAS